MALNKSSIILSSTE